MVLKRVPFLIIIVIISLIIYFKLWHYLNFDSLRYYYLECAAFVSRHFWLAVFYFCLTYIVVVATSIPGGIILTLLAGFLFGNIVGTILVVLSAAFGATILVIAIRLAFKDVVSVNIRLKVKFMEERIGQDTFFYLLSLRLLPIIPFFLINLAAGVLDIRLKDFFLATLIGITPVSFIYANIGSNLGVLLEETNFKLSDLIMPQVLIALALLALLSLLPVLIKYIKR